MFLKSSIKKFILILALFLPSIVHADFNVKMSCTAYGQNYDWWQCLNSKYVKSGGFIVFDDLHISGVNLR